MSADLPSPALSAGARGYVPLVQATPSVRNGNGVGGGAGGVPVLFVASDSIYKSLGCDCYDAERDARTYAGNAPVVAHPPCQRWGNLAAMNFKRYGGEHNRPGNDGGLFAFAVAVVRRCGGVLEHPRSSKAFAAHDITPPIGLGWQRVMCGGWVCEVWQSAYGHRANKATWLYYYGETQPEELRWERIVGTHQISSPPKVGTISRNSKKPRVGIGEADATPIEFARALLSLAGRAAGAGVGRCAPTTGKGHNGAHERQDERAKTTPEDRKP
jgi:hypothetical protein